jgi:glycosyltransferase involved in cell wall biosynthesis
VSLLGARPYEDVPAYLQHADVIIVPHRITPFTESLDPIKAYECLAVGTPTVATPIAGFRIHADVLNVVDRDEFPALVHTVLKTPPPRLTGAGAAISWQDRVAAFESVLDRVSALAVAVARPRPRG